MLVLLALINFAIAAINSTRAITRAAAGIPESAVVSGLISGLHIGVGIACLFVLSRQ